MILVLGGTLEGREIADALANENHDVLLTVVSGYGAGMIPHDSPVELLVGRLDAGEMARLITDRDIRLVVDATHPYARVITETAWKTANGMGIPYIRYERPPVLTEKPDDRIYVAGSYEQAAELAAELGETIFLTIGSKNIEPFVRTGREYSRKVVARVLPDPKILEHCLAIGLAPKDIIAVQGPFSYEMNLAMFREYKADVLVTKDSGRTGGTDAKLKAARQIDIPAVVIERPGYRGMPVTDKIQEVVSQANRIKEQCNRGSK